MRLRIWRNPHPNRDRPYLYEVGHDDMRGFNIAYQTDFLVVAWFWKLFGSPLQ